MERRLLNNNGKIECKQIVSRVTLIVWTIGRLLGQMPDSRPFTRGRYV